MNSDNLLMCPKCCRFVDQLVRNSVSDIELFCCFHCSLTGVMDDFIVIQQEKEDKTLLLGLS